MEVSAALRSHRFGDPIRRNVGSAEEARRVVEVFVPRQAAVDRLSQQIRQVELRVHAVAGIAQVVRDEFLQSEAFIQLTNKNKSGVGGDVRSLERNLQEAIEGELKRLVFFFGSSRDRVGKFA